MTHHKNDYELHHASHHKAGWVLKSFLILVILGVGSLFLGYRYINNYYQSAGPLKQNTTIIIEKGTSLIKIVNILAEQGVVEQPQLLSTYLRIAQPSISLKAGEYQFAPAISPKAAIAQLANEDTVTHTLTIPEGLMTTQVLQLVDQEHVLTGPLPTDVKEGELLPETYSFKYGDSKAEVVEHMRKQMTQTINELWKTRDENLPFTTKEEALTLASIIEKETGQADERRRVAAVFVNRLRKKMRLQSDPTSIYSITKGEYVFEGRLLKKHLATESPYNTYKVAGLPPGPIANPGKESIAAALKPLATNELYFVADGTGGHAFATNLNDHINNVNRWRKIRKSRKD